MRNNYKAADKAIVRGFRLFVGLLVALQAAAFYTILRFSYSDLTATAAPPAEAATPVAPAPPSRPAPPIEFNSELDVAYALLEAAESGQRLFRLTHDPKYLEPAKQAEGMSEKRLSLLRPWRRRTPTNWRSSRTWSRCFAIALPSRPTPVTAPPKALPRPRRPPNPTPPSGRRSPACLMPCTVRPPRRPRGNKPRSGQWRPLGRLGRARAAPCDQPGWTRPTRSGSCSSAPPMSSRWGSSCSLSADSSIGG